VGTLLGRIALGNTPSEAEIETAWIDSIQPDDLGWMDGWS